MAKKEGGTQARLAKAKKVKTGKPCPVCGEVPDMLQVIDPVQTAGGLKFKKTFVRVCNCNRKEYGM